MSEKEYRILFLGDVAEMVPEYLSLSGVPPSLESLGSNPQITQFLSSTDFCIVNAVPASQDSYDAMNDVRASSDDSIEESPWARLMEAKRVGVNLATEQIGKLGKARLQHFRRTLQDHGVPVFGAGSTHDEAFSPLMVSVPEEMGGGTVALYGNLHDDRARRRRQSEFTTQDRVGCAYISGSMVPHRRLEGEGAAAIHLALPRWSSPTSDRTFEQYRIGQRLLRRGFTGVIGHGAPAIQEIDRIDRRWVSYNIGRGPLADSQEGSADKGLSTYVSVLKVVQPEQGPRRVALCHYPVGPGRDGEMRMADTSDLEELAEKLRRRHVAAWRFDNPEQSIAWDDLGAHFRLELGEWPAGGAPELLPPLTADGDPGDWTTREPARDAEDQFLDLDKVSMGASMMAIQAELHGGRVDWVTPRQAIITHGTKRFMAYGYVGTESRLGGAVCTDKVLTAQYLMAASVPTPVTHVVRSPDEAAEVARGMVGPVVVKPADGKKSRGVTTDLSVEEDVRRAFEEASAVGNPVLVQQHIESEEEIRVMVAGEGAFAVTRRLLPHVIGDGVSSIRQLIADKNLQRELNPSLRARPIPMDAATVAQLDKQGYSLDSVSPEGEWVTVRNVAGLSVGADPHQAYETASPEIRSSSAQAVAAIPGLDWGGVDLIIEKGTGKPFVLEINTDAAFGQAMFPSYGEPRNVAEIAWKRRLRGTQDAVTGEPGVPESLEEAVPVLPVRAAADQDPRAGLLSTVFRQYLDAHGCQYEFASPRVMRVRRGASSESLLTSSLLGRLDRSAAVRVLQRHSLVRKVLAVAGVPRPRGQAVSTPEELRDYAGREVGPLVLVPRREAWQGGGAQETDAEAVSEMAESARGASVQRRVSGLRLRVLSTAREGRVVIGRPQSGSVGAGDLTEAVSVAVAAVRAVPELRWAAVDVVVRRKGSALVEGMTLKPRFDARDEIIAGDLEGFFEWIIESSEIA